MSWITTIGSGIAAACPTQGAVRSSGWVVSLGPAKILLRSILAGAAVGLFPSVARAELPSAEPDFGVVGWETAGGVPGKNITAIARTPDGYLWLGTEVGLRRFDGTRFVPITMNDVPALGGNYITSLMVDASGTLWVGTRNGTLSRRVGGTFQALELDPRLGDAPIESLTADKEGGIWFATERSGLVHMVRGAFEFVGGTDGLPPGAARSMVRLASGEWWAFAGLHGTGTASLVRLRNGQWQHVAREPPDTWIWALKPDRQGHGLWLATRATKHGTMSRGTRVFKLVDGKVVGELGPYPWPQDSQHSYILDLIEDDEGRVWLGTHLNGTYNWQPGRGWRELESPEGHHYLQPRRFFEDGEGILWMATRNELLYRITRQPVANVPLPPELDKPIITSVCPSRNGFLWVGTESSGVFRDEDGRFVRVTRGMPEEHIGPLFEDSRSRLWVGTRGGLYAWRGDGFQRVLADSIRGPVEALYEDRQGNMLIGNGPQVVRLEPDGRFQVFDQGLGPAPVWALAEDNEHRIFATQLEARVSWLQGDRFEQFPDPGSGAIEYRALLPDDDGSVWISTYGSGLRRLLHGEFQDWREEDGLPSDDVRCILEDGAGNLWLGSTKGIFGTTRRALLEYDRGESPPVQFWQLDEEDGLVGALTTGLGQPVAARSADGRLWFPSRNVVAVFDPREVTRPREAVLPFIEEIVADGVVAPREPDGSLQFAPGVRQLTIHYTCTDLRSPEHDRFRYRLEGLDEDWNEADASDRRATYTHLPPGEYVFQVRASNSGLWNEEGASVVLTVLPAWWQTTWFRLAAALSLMAFLFLLHRFRIKYIVERNLQLASEIEERKRAESDLVRSQGELHSLSGRLVMTQEEERRRVARELHDGVNQQLAMLSMRLGVLAKRPPDGPEETSHRLEELKTTALGLSREVRDVSHRLHSSELEHLGLVQALRTECSRVEKDTGMKIDLDTDEAPDSCPLGPALCLYRVAQESLANAVKHSGASRMRVRLAGVDGGMELAVTDDGAGFDPQAARGGGLGLGSMEERVRYARGRFQLTSHPGTGTEVRVWVPIDTTAAKEPSDEEASSAGGRSLAGRRRP